MPQAALTTPKRGSSATKAAEQAGCLSCARTRLRLRSARWRQPRLRDTHRVEHDCAEEHQRGRIVGAWARRTNGSRPEMALPVTSQWCSGRSGKVHQQPSQSPIVSRNWASVVSGAVVANLVCSASALAVVGLATGQPSRWSVPWRLYSSGMPDVPLISRFERPPAMAPPAGYCCRPCPCRLRTAAPNG